MFSSLFVRAVALALLCGLALAQVQPEQIKCRGYKPTDVCMYWVGQRGRNVRCALSGDNKSYILINPSYHITVHLSLPDALHQSSGPIGSLQGPLFSLQQHGHRKPELRRAEHLPQPVQDRVRSVCGDWTSWGEGRGQCEALLPASHLTEGQHRQVHRRSGSLRAVYAWWHSVRSMARKSDPPNPSSIHQSAPTDTFTSLLTQMCENFCCVAKPDLFPNSKRLRQQLKDR